MSIPSQIMLLPMQTPFPETSSEWNIRHLCVQSEENSFVLRRANIPKEYTKNYTSQLKQISQKISDVIASHALTSAKILNKGDDIHSDN